MAQTGFTPIVTYNTATATTVPSAANLAQGELAVNVTDKKLYTKDSGGNVVLLASNGGDVTGPASSTNLAIPTFSGTGGKTILDNSGVTISAGVITATGFSGPLNGSLGATTPSTAVVTSLNKMAITAPATSSTLAVADGKTLTANKTLTLTGTDGTTMTFPATSATIARTDAAQTFTGVQTFNSSVLGNGGIVASANTAGAVMNITTAQNNGTTASPLYVDLNLKGYLDNIQGRIRAFDAAGNTTKSSVMISASNASTGALTDIASFFGGGGVSIGNTTDPGATNLSVTGNINAAKFYTSSGNTGEIATATATTIYAIPSAGVFTVGARLVAGVGDAATYAATATVIYDGSDGKITAINGTLLTITLSGANIRVTQSSGATQGTGVSWSILHQLLP
jgi:hypothetical protein